VQIVLPPATWPDQVVMAIRRPSERHWSLDELTRAGLFGGTAQGRAVADGARLAASHAAGNWRDFLSLAVRGRLNIVVAGATGSGKTTLTKAMIREIPLDERLVSIEDAAELVFDRHRNVVRLFYSKDGQGVARVTPRQLLEASLRLRPDRILLAELRGEEAYDFLRSVSSGHPGSITSVHAGSPELALAQLALLVKSSRAGSELGMEDIDRLLRQTIDVIVQGECAQGTRRVTRVWWRGSDFRS
jgi:type IV secretion system protein VirB11